MAKKIRRLLPRGPSLQNLRSEGGLPSHSAVKPFERLIQANMAVLKHYLYCTVYECVIRNELLNDPNLDNIRVSNSVLVVFIFKKALASGQIGSFGQGRHDPLCYDTPIKSGSKRNRNEREKRHYNSLQNPILFIGRTYKLFLAMINLNMNNKASTFTTTSVSFDYENKLIKV
ncbi:jg15024 [Pararge aegeria aegeria]|uniref:Jg15024 protein n=1 Tax=Pararge aegeria aegeria TaxID=348720 RepID=A0A8S4RER9_9NEOP|nr:jg15024 [Pararge aegeria aegeria]